MTNYLRKAIFKKINAEQFLELRKLYKQAVKDNCEHGWKLWDEFDNACAKYHLTAKQVHALVSEYC